MVALCLVGTGLFYPLTLNVMLQLFIELTDQIFWEGYAEQLATDNPAVFQRELADFMNCYYS